MPSICFVALNAYNVFARSDVQHIGGAEIQQSLMARWLADRGWEVSVIARDHGQAKDEVVDDIRLVKAYNIDSGLPLLRFFHPRWSALHSAMKSVDADYYYQRGAGTETGQVALFCRLNSKRFIFATASDTNTDYLLPTLKRPLERILYRYGLRNANSRIVQTHYQHRELKKNFGFESHVIHSVSENKKFAQACFETASYILWVGNFGPIKRVEWLLECAKQCPDLQFRIVGRSNHANDYASELIAQAEAVSNVRLFGEVSKEHMPDQYANAKLLVSTSIREGYPNVFIEAWRQGVPVIATVDPDELLSRGNAGIHVEDKDALCNSVRELSSNQEQWSYYAAQGRQLFESLHDINNNMSRFLSVVTP